MSSRGLAQSGIPLGGIGAGTVELRADGYCREWQLMNNAPWGSGPPFTAPGDSLWFGLQVSAPGLSRSIVLGLAPSYGTWLNDPYQLPWLEHASSIDAEMRFPITILDYRYRSPPVSVRLEACTPFIPLDEDDSGLPIAFFSFRLLSRVEMATRVSLVACLRNLVGYEHQGCPSRVKIGEGGGAPFMLLSREGLPPTCQSRGSLALSVLGPAAHAASHVAHPWNARDIWEPLRAVGRLSGIDRARVEPGDSRSARRERAALRRGLPVAALCHSVRLPAGGSRTVTFALAWHFPRMSELACPERGTPSRVIGHHYAVRFTSAAAVAAYGAANARRLLSRTRAFHDAYYGSSLPGWLLQAVSAPLAALRKSSWWDRRGRFGIWEGLGCCGLQTMDVGHYGSFAVQQLFPALERSQLLLTASRSDGPGRIAHAMPGSFACSDVDPKDRIDLVPQFVLAVWRDVRWSGDRRLLRRLWPQVKMALERYGDRDVNRDGLPDNKGPDQTYDQFPMRGTSAYVGFLYAAALRAASELAEWANDRPVGMAYRRQTATVLATLEEQLWNGGCYRLSFDAGTGHSDEGVMADQLNGDWFVRQTTGSGLVADAKARSALRMVLRRCLHPAGFMQNCSWPEGCIPEVTRNRTDQANRPWTGVEYTLAAHLALLGMPGEARRVARLVWERQERVGLRFNHVECGEFYYRALASWALYGALAGVLPSAGGDGLCIARRRVPSRFLFFTNTGWGVVTSGRSGIVISVMAGFLRLRRLSIDSMGATRASATLGRIRVPCAFSISGGSATLLFERPAHVHSGEELRARLR